MPWAISRETDATNLPLSGGKVYTYQAGTTTPYPTWADADQTIPNANPVILDAGGFRCSTDATLYCGTVGCGVDTLIDGTRGLLTLHSWEVLTEDGVTYLTAPNDAGETVRFLWSGTEWVLQ